MGVVAGDPRSGEATRDWREKRGYRHYCHATAAAPIATGIRFEPHVLGEPLNTPLQWLWHLSQLTLALRCHAVIS